MNLLFAEATLSQWSAPTGTAAWLAIAGFLLFIFNQGRKALGGMKDKPAPGEVRFEAVNKFATKEDLASLNQNNESAHKDLFSKIGGVERGMAARLDEKLKTAHEERRADMQILHHDINSVGQKVAGLEKQTELQNQTLSAVTTDIKRILHEMPRA